MLSRKNTSLEHVLACVLLLCEKRPQIVLPASADAVPDLCRSARRRLLLVSAAICHRHSTRSLLHLSIKHLRVWKGCLCSVAAIHMFQSADRRAAHDCCHKRPIWSATWLPNQGCFLYDLVANFRGVLPEFVRRRAFISACLNHCHSDSSLNKTHTIHFHIFNIPHQQFCRLYFISCKLHLESPRMAHNWLAVQHSEFYGFHHRSDDNCYI